MTKILVIAALIAYGAFSAVGAAVNASQAIAGAHAVASR